MFKRQPHGLDSIKAALDNLPSGLCFFDLKGRLILSNHKMNELYFEMSGSNLQYQPQLEALLAEKQLPEAGCLCPVGKDAIWQFDQDRLVLPSGKVCIQYTATDVTQLHKNMQLLAAGNQQLKAQAERLRQLNADIEAVTRQEELLHLKMRLHDDLGRSTITARRLLRDSQPIKDEDLALWQDTVSLLKNPEYLETGSDIMEQLLHWARQMDLEIVMTGSLPDSIRIRNLCAAAVRECAANALRHGHARTMYVKTVYQPDSIVLTITNDGLIPAKAVQEGGGLRALRRRLENQGARLRITSFPQFQLEAVFYKGKEDPHEDCHDC